MTERAWLLAHIDRLTVAYERSKAQAPESSHPVLDGALTALRAVRRDVAEGRHRTGEAA